MLLRLFYEITACSLHLWLYAHCQEFDPIDRTCSATPRPSWPYADLH